MSSSTSFTFSLVSSSGPRLGTLNGSLPTPRSFPITRRGVIPHLYPQPKDLGWVMFPFESFLEHNPPLPILFGLRELTGFSSGTIHLTLRDPRDTREMPPNSKDGINANCLRGVRKVTAKDWVKFAHDLKPTVVSALSDTPFPVSSTQKRLAKSIERTYSWLCELVRPDPESGLRLNVLCPLQGAHSTKARTAFSKLLAEEVFEKRELAPLTPHNNLDDCLAGYILECAPLKPTADLVDLLTASLTPLPAHRLRVATLTSSVSPRLPNGGPSQTSPHEILTLVDQVGIDLFDADAWAIECAEVGVSLDFTFPVAQPEASSQPRDVGHNLYLHSYSTQFHPLSEPCDCPTCGIPIGPAENISHSSVDFHSYTSPVRLSESHTKAYIHHLLQTHEMSAHSLLARHNMAVIDRFFQGIRAIITKASSPDDFKEEIERFNKTYELPDSLLKDAYTEWARVEYERGRGRLAREREKEREQQEALNKAASGEEGVDIKRFAELSTEDEASTVAPVSSEQDKVLTGTGAEASSDV